MILEQNYIKIAQYTQKSFKLYSRRSLANILLKKLDQKHKKQLFSKFENTYTKNIEKNQSELNTFKQDINTEYYKTAKQIKQTQSQNIQTFKQNIDYEYLYYGDTVMIEVYNNGLNFMNEPQKRQVIYSQLDALKYDNVNKLPSDIVMYRKCAFQLVNPYDCSSKALITPHSLIALKSVFYNNYATLTDQIVKDLFFGYRIVLTQQITKYSLVTFFSTTNNDELLTFQPVGLKFYNKFLRAQNNKISGNNDGSVFYFTKINESQKLLPNYFYIKNMFLNQYLTTNQIEIAKLMTKKTFTNVLIEDQDLSITKINQLSIAKIDFSKIIEAQIYLDNNSSKNCQSVKQIWEFRKVQSNNNNRISQNQNKSLDQINLFSISQKKGAIIKVDKNIRLTSNSKQFSKFYLNKQQTSSEQVYQIINQNTNTSLTILRNKQQNNKFNLCLSQNQNNYKLQQNKKTQYILQKVQKQQCFLIMELLDIQQIVKKNYLFFQDWGFVYEQKNEVIKFSVQQIKLKKMQLQNALLQTRKVMIKLQKLILNNSQTSNYIQNMAREFKIFQVFIYLAKIIMVKILKKDSKENAKKNINIHNVDMQDDFDQKPKTSQEVKQTQQVLNPFSLSKSLLEGFFLELFDLFLILIKSCQGSSTTVINQAGFFNKLLIWYPQPIGKILKQAIKNLSIFTTKHSNSSQHSQLFQWAKLIQPLKSQTVQIQKIYIDIIAQVVIDPQDNGIIPYQNKCKELLFNQRNKKRSIPRFSIESQRPTIILDSSINQFLSYNIPLSYLEIASAQNASFYIEDFYQQHDLWKQKQDIQLYTKYIISVIRLIRNLCKDRNKKLIKIAQDNGLTKNHISQCLSNFTKIGWRLKFQYLSLYSCFYIDQQPLLCFQKRQQKCHIWQKIRQYDLQTKTSIIFNQYTDMHLALQKYKQFQLHVIPFIQAFIHQCNLINQNQEKSAFTIQKSQNSVKMHKKSQSKFKKVQRQFQYQQICQCFFIFLKVIYDSLNFGYFSLKFLKRYVIFGINQFQHLFYESKQKNIQKQQHKLLEHKILLQLLDIINLTQEILIGIHCMNLLKRFQKAISENSVFFTNNQLQQFCIKVLYNDFNLLQEKKQYQKLNQEIIMNKKKTTFRKVVFQNVAVEQIQNKEFDWKVGDFLVNLNFTYVQEYNKKIYQKILESSEIRIKRGQNISRRLKQFLILQGQKQQMLYQDYSGRVVGKWITIIKLQDLVNKIKISQLQMTDDHQDQKRKKQKVIELNNLLTKIIKEMKNFKEQNLNVLNKFQCILQKLNLHSILLQLLQFSQKSIYFDLISSIYVFLLQFIWENQKNRNKIEVYFEHFLKNLKIPKSGQLISQLFWTKNRQHKFALILNELHFSTEDDAKQNILEAIYLIIKLDTNNQLKNKKAEMGLSILKENIIQTIFNYSNLSVQYTNLLCEISKDCEFIAIKVRNIYPKTSLRNYLFRKNQYLQRTMYMKLYYYFYIKKLEIQDNQVETIFQNLILPELKHLPSVCQFYALQKVKGQQNKFNSQKINQIKQKYQKLIVYDQSSIPPSQQQKYWNFLFNSFDQNQISLINFTTNLLKHDFDKKKSRSYQELIFYLKQLCSFLNMVFSSNNQSYQKKMLNKLQQILIMHDEQNPNKKNTFYFQLSEVDKQFLKQFFNNFAKLIKSEKLSYNKIVKCAHLDIQLLNRKRSGQFIQKLILQSQFICFFKSIGQLIKNQNQYFKLVKQSVISQLFNIYRSKSVRKINIYKFVQKIIQTLQYLKTTAIIDFHQKFQSFQRQNSKQLRHLKKRHEFYPNKFIKLVHFNRYVQIISKCFQQNLKDFLLNRGVSRMIAPNFFEIQKQLLSEQSIKNIMKIHTRFIDSKVNHKVVLIQLKNINKQHLPLKIDSAYLRFYLNSIKEIIVNTFQDSYINIIIELFQNFSKFNARQNFTILIHFLVEQFPIIYFQNIMKKIQNLNIFVSIEQFQRYLIFFLQYIDLLRLGLSSTIMPQKQRDLLQKYISDILNNWAKICNLQNQILLIQIVQKIVKILICNYEDCQILVHEIASNQETISLKMNQLNQRVLRKLFYANIEQSVSLRYLNTFLKLALKLNIKSHKQQLAILLNYMNFSLIFDKITNIDYELIVGKNNKSQSRCQQYSYNMACSEFVCNQTKNTAFIDQRMQLIFNLLIIFQISVSFLRQGYFRHRISQKNVNALLQFDQIVNGCNKKSQQFLQLKNLTSSISSINYCSQKGVLMNFQFQVPKISYYLTNNIKQDIIQKISLIESRQIYKELNKFSIYFQACLQDRKAYSKFVIMNFIQDYKDFITLILLVTNLIITISVIFLLDIEQFLLYGVSSLFILIKLFMVFITFKKFYNNLKYLNDFQIIPFFQKFKIAATEGLNHQIVSCMLYILTFISPKVFTATLYFQISILMMHQIRQRAKCGRYFFYGLFILIFGFVVCLFLIGVREVSTDVQFTSTYILQLLFQFYSFCFGRQNVQLQQFHKGDKFVLFVFALAFITFLSYTVIKIIITLMENDKIKKQKYNRCFICLKSDATLRRQGNNFLNHIKLEHSWWSYLFFFISLRTKQGRQSIENYVKTSIDNKKYTFVRLW